MGLGIPLDTDTPVNVNVSHCIVFMAFLIEGGLVSSHHERKNKCVESDLNSVSTYFN